jgi:hypothetical protein
MALNDTDAPLGELFIPIYEPVFYFRLKEAAQRIISHPGQSFTTLVAIFLVFGIFQATLTRFLHLRQFSGPWCAAYTRLWLCKVIASRDSAQIFVGVNKKFGPLARIGPNHLITDDPDFTKRILAARSHYTRGPWFDSIKIDPHIPNIVSERNHGKHNHLRYQMSAGYAGKDIEGPEAAINERMTSFIDYINRNWISTLGATKVFDIGKRIQFLAIDIITHLCFGEPLGFVDRDSDIHNFIATIETQLPIVQHFSVILELNTLLLRLVDIPGLRKFIVPSSRDKTGIGRIMGVSVSVPVDMPALIFHTYLQVIRSPVRL